MSRDEYLIKSRVKSFCLFCRVGFAFFQSGDATSVERCYIFSVFLPETVWSGRFKSRKVLQNSPEKTTKKCSYAMNIWWPVRFFGVTMTMRERRRVYRREWLNDLWNSFWLVEHRHTHYIANVWMMNFPTVVVVIRGNVLFWSSQTFSGLSAKFHSPALIERCSREVLWLFRKSDSN